MEASSAEHKETEEYFYQPFSATQAALALYACAILIAWVLNYLLTGHPLPWSLPLGDFGLIATLSLMLAPIAFGLQLGWSYLLRSDSLSVLRFGRERFRVPLEEYQGGDSRLGVFRLRFATRNVWIIENAREERELFLGALTRMAGQAGHAPAPAVAADRAGRVEVALLGASFGRCCITCGGVREDEVELSVRRGIDIGFITFIEFATVHVPVCRQHARSYRLWQHGVWLVYLAIGGAIALWFMATWARPDLGNALLTGLVFAGFLFLPFHRMGWHRLRDWKGLGIRATKLHADLQRATFVCANDEIRERLVSAASRRQEVSVAVDPD